MEIYKINRRKKEKVVDKREKVWYIIKAATEERPGGQEAPLSKKEETKKDEKTSWQRGSDMI